MLYDRWLRLVRELETELALVDLSSGQQWTFQQLAALVDAPSHPSPIVFAQGVAPKFVQEVLRAWRSGAIVCPLENGQPPPAFTAPPPGTAHLKTTSATTGVPKCIAFTAEQIMADVDQIVATMGLRRDWPNVAAISLAHSYGFSNLVLPLLLHGIPLVHARSALPECIREACSAFPRVALPAVPALWRTWAEAAALPSSIQLGISAGAPLPLALEEEVLRRFDLKIHNFYGATECGGIAYDAGSGPRQEAGCVGQAMHGVELALNSEGCLRVESAAVGLTYWPEPSADLRAGCFQTSDLAEIRDENVFLRGRQSDQINVAGRKLSPDTVEQALATHPQVRQCLVFGAPSPDDNRAELIVACVACRSSVTSADLRRHLQARLPAWQIPRAWWFVPELPVNVRGKVARREWQRRYVESLDKA